jgi:hypothetical protein
MEANVGLDEAVIVLHLAAAAVTASQQAVAVVPVTPGPLFWVLAATVPSPAEQSTSVEESVFPVHLPVTVLEAVGQVTGESSVKAPKLPHVNWVANGAAPGTGL